jgi:predicted MPP superfamily phosphohydrolase
MDSLTGALSVLGTAAMGTALYRAAAIEPFDIQLKQVLLKISGMPRALDGLRILHISDLHIGSVGRTEKRLIELVQPEEADIIVFTGDYVKRRYGALPNCLHIVKKLAAGRKAFGVLGNNDYNPEIATEAMVDLLQEAGVDILLNEQRTFTYNGQKVTIAGVDDPVWGFDNLDKIFKNRSERWFTFLLAHSPVIFDKAVRCGIDLVLAGHTHGGQICFPNHRPVYRNIEHTSEYIAGEFRKEKTVMYVNKGVGTTRLPLRFFCRPEVVLLTLTP